MRGFDLLCARRPATALERIAGRRSRSTRNYPDGRIAPVSRLANGVFRRDREGGDAAARIRRRLPRADAHRRRATRAPAGPRGSTFAATASERSCAREPYPRHRRQRLHRLRAGQGAGQGGHDVRVLDDNSRGSPRRLAERRSRYRIHRRRHPRCRGRRAGGARHGRSAPPRLRQRHRIFLHRSPTWCSMSACAA